MGFVDDLIKNSTFGLVDTNFFGGEDPSVQGYAQSPGQTWLQGALQPQINDMLYRLGQGRQAYPTPQPPEANWQLPQAPFSSPADFAGGYETILNRMIEPFGESLGSPRGGWSGAGKQVLGSAMGEIAPQIMNQYTQSVLPYAQMQNQQGLAGYSMGQIPEWQNITNAYNPMPLASMFGGTYGSPVVNPGQQGMFQSAANMLPLFALSSIF